MYLRHSNELLHAVVAACFKKSPINPFKAYVITLRLQYSVAVHIYIDMVIDMVMLLTWVSVMMIVGEAFAWVFIVLSVSPSKAPCTRLTCVHASLW